MSARESVDQPEQVDTVTPTRDKEVAQVADSTQVAEVEDLTQVADVAQVAEVTEGAQKEDLTQVAEVAQMEDLTQVADVAEVTEGVQKEDLTQVAEVTEGIQKEDLTHVAQVAEQPPDTLERHEERVDTPKEPETIEPLQDFESPNIPITPTGQHSNEEVRLLPSRPTHLLTPESPSAVEPPPPIEGTGINTESTVIQGSCLYAKLKG